MYHNQSKFEVQLIAKRLPKVAMPCRLAADLGATAAACVRPSLMLQTTLLAPAYVGRDKSFPLTNLTFAYYSQLHFVFLRYESSTLILYKELSSSIFQM